MKDIPVNNCTSDVLIQVLSPIRSKIMEQISHTYDVWSMILFDFCFHWDCTRKQDFSNRKSVYSDFPIDVYCFNH